MSKLNLGRIQNENEDGSASVSVSGISTFSSTAFLQLSKGSTAQRPENPQPGMIRFNTDSGHLEYYTGEFWDEALVENNTLDGGARGVFAGGDTPTKLTTIEYITINSLGNVIFFGDLSNTVSDRSSCSSSTRGLFAGGTNSNLIQFITFSSTGNTTTFGNLTLSRNSLSACSSSTRGLFGGGVSTGPVRNNLIDYVTIASTGNAQDFGDLTIEYSVNASCSNSIRGIFSGGISGAVPSTTVTNSIEYVTISTTGNSQDFGDLTSGPKRDHAACSNSTRGVFAGGFTPTLSPATINNIIEFITISSTGNAIDFGDLTVVRRLLAGCSSSTRAVFGGGLGPASPSDRKNTIDYITITSQGDALDFGDLSSSKDTPIACSNGHGGL